MKNIKKTAFILFTSVLYSSASQATFLPANKLYLEDKINITNRLTQRDFFQVINFVQASFAPIVASHNGQLIINGHWNDSTVNAFASRPQNNIWQIDMFGGLARRPEITLDGFALVICHELGHHLGGYPFKRNDWAASEGQSDYYATQVCTRRIWAYDLQTNARFRYTASPFAKATCDRMWRTTAAQNLCYRTTEASLSLANLLSATKKDRIPPRYQFPVRTRVQTTNVIHPAAQCRLDTMLNGAVCTRPFDVRHIPGLEIEIQGGQPLEMEKDAARFSCEEMGMPFDGSRPACWFRQLLPRWR